jgi:hypothetical protein
MARDNITREQTMPTKTVVTRSGTCIWLAWLAFVLVLFWLTIFVMVPTIKRHLDERGLAYPGITKLTLDFTISIANSALVLIPVSCLMVLGGVVLGRHVQPTPPMGMRFGQIATAVLFGAIVAILIGMGWVVPGLVRGLSK